MCDDLANFRAPVEGLDELVRAGINKDRPVWDSFSGDVHEMASYFLAVELRDDRELNGFLTSDIEASIRRVRETAVSCADTTCGHDIPPKTTYVECDDGAYCNDQCHNETHGKCQAGRYAEWEED